MQVTEMNCQEARKLFSLHLDKILSPGEEAEVLGHISSCFACREDLAGLRALLETLRSLPGLTPPAPAGLAAGIMVRLEEIENRRRRLSGWRRWVAAAAAALTLATGSLAYAARGWTPAGWLAALSSGPPAGQALPGPGDPGPNPDSGFSMEGRKGDNGAGNQPVIGEEQGQAPPAGDKKESLPPKEGKETGGSPGPGEKSSSPGNEPGGEASPLPTTVAQNQPVSPVAFLNKERKINSTFLKVAASDIDQALAAALKAGATVKATSQVFAVQNTGTEQRAAVRFTVAPEVAPALVDKLVNLGTLLDKRQESEDITARFSATLEQYRETVAKANAVQETAEREQLLTQANFLEKQLATWDKEAGEHVVILWLEKG